MRAPYRYAHKLRREDAVVLLLGCPESRLASLANGLFATGQRFGFTFCSSVGGLPAIDAPVVHGIMVVDVPASADTVDVAATHIRNGVGSVSMAFSYPSLAALKASATAVEEFKRQHGDKLNFLRPDSEVQGNYRVSDQKILDNAVCDTVRVKYLPRQRQVTCRGWLDDGAVRHFRDAFDAVARFRLYHRAPTDGYVALRRGDGFLITATKTSKLAFDPERISYVHGFDEFSNVVEYSGPFLPSSDAVEASVIYGRLPSINSLVHTHASDRFTRNPAFAEFIQVPRLPYGEPELGRSLADVIARQSSGMVIMDDHGEVFYSTDELGAVSVVRDLCAKS
jgi:hypothetical protein